MCINGNHVWSIQLQREMRTCPVGAYAFSEMAQVNEAYFRFILAVADLMFGTPGLCVLDFQKCSEHLQHCSHNIYSNEAQNLTSTAPSPIVWPDANHSSSSHRTPTPTSAAHEPDGPPDTGLAKLQAAAVRGYKARIEELQRHLARSDGEIKRQQDCVSQLQAQLLAAHRLPSPRRVPAESGRDGSPSPPDGDEEPRTAAARAEPGADVDPTQPAQPTAVIAGLQAELAARSEAVRELEEGAARLRQHALVQAVVIRELHDHVRGLEARARASEPEPRPLFPPLPPLETVPAPPPWGGSVRPSCDGAEAADESSDSDASESEPHRRAGGPDQGRQPLGAMVERARRGLPLLQHLWLIVLRWRLLCVCVCVCVCVWSNLCVVRLL